MPQLEVVRETLVIDDDGRATITLDREQLLLLETFVAQPKWKQAARDTAAMFRRLGL
jgi:hypothetical protein